MIKGQSELTKENIAVNQKKERRDIEKTRENGELGKEYESRSKQDEEIRENWVERALEKANCMVKCTTYGIIWVNDAGSIKVIMREKNLSNRNAKRILSGGIQKMS